MAVTVARVRQPRMLQQGQPTCRGGFDLQELVNDLTRDCSFLALLYPASDANELAIRLGTIDYIAP